VTRRLLLGYLGLVIVVLAALEVPLGVENAHTARRDLEEIVKAAADAGKFGIGVDSNQNHLHPGTMLTSMLKRVDLAAYNSFKAAQGGTWKAGTQVLEGNGGALHEQL